LRARAKELEEALKGSERKIEELRQRIRFLESQLEESRKAIPVVTEQLLREEPKPMGAGKSSAAILAMAVAAAMPKPERR
jgi:prefoldin subunit 5